MKNFTTLAILAILLLISICKKGNSNFYEKSEKKSLSEKKYVNPKYTKNDSLFGIYYAIKPCQEKYPEKHFFDYVKSPDFNPIKNNILIQYAFDYGSTLPKFQLIYKNNYPNDTLVCFLKADSVVSSGIRYLVESQSFLLIDINKAFNDLKPYNILQIRDLNHCTKFNYKLNKY